MVSENFSKLDIVEVTRSNARISSFIYADFQFLLSVELENKERTGMQSDSEITGFGLNRQAIIELYKDIPLYLVPEPKAYDGFDFTGANLRNVLILLPQELKRYDQPVQDMLMKMMAAIGLELNDVALVNVNQYPGLRFSSLAEFLHPKQLCSSGYFRHHLV